MNKIFITVNYGTSNLVENWIASIRKLSNYNQIIIVDNFFSEEERKKMIYLSRELSFFLIESENIGYGRALNKAFEYLKQLNIDLDDNVIFAGNLDIEFRKIDFDFKKGNNVYIPLAMENNRNRNPFLTKIQKNFLFLHRFSLTSNKTFVFKIVILIIKLLSLIPSKIWALHGSLFIFNGSILKYGVIFNENTFLYSEELEFASFAENISKSNYIQTSIEYKHIGHVATSIILSDKRKFFNAWKPGFINWLKRWSQYQ